MKSWMIRSDGGVHICGFEASRRRGLQITVMHPELDNTSVTLFKGDSNPIQFSPHDAGPAIDVVGLDDQ